MRVLIFTEGGSNTGFGHIIRCSSIYEELKSRGIETYFITYGDFESTEILKNVKFENINWYFHSYLKDFIKEDDYCIVDSYIAEEDTYEVISNLARTCLFLDDYYRIKYPKGTVIIPSLKKKEFVDSTTLTRYIAGPHVICLRHNFTKIESRSIRKDLANVLITLGGSDITAFLKQIIKSLCRKYPNIFFHVVSGRKNINIESEEFDNVQLYTDLTAEEMKQLMLMSDLTITGSGQTVYELIATRTPFIPIKVAENQQSIVSNLLELSLTNDFINYLEDDPLRNLLNNFEKNIPYSVRKNQYEKFSNFIDRNSTKNIVNYFLINHDIEDKFRLRVATNEDIYNVYHLSNDSTVRANSINQKKIIWKNHREWFNKVINNDQYLFLIIEDKNNKFVGQVRFEIKYKVALISISIEKEYRGNGISLSILLKSVQECTQYFENVKNIIAYIKISNIASKKLFERAGFKFVENQGDYLKYTITVGA